MGQQLKLFGEDLVTEAEEDATADDTVEQLQPLFDQILVLPLAAAGKTKGGLYLPQTARQDRQVLRGRVMAIGDGIVDNNGKLRSPKVKVGDHVVFGQFAGVDIEIGDAKVKIVREGDIIAKVNKKPTEVE